MAQKLYPFSMWKHSHSIRLAEEHYYILARDADNEKDYESAEKYEAEYERIAYVYNELTSYMPNSAGVIMIPGKLIGEAKEILFTAEHIRSSLNMRR